MSVSAKMQRAIEETENPRGKILDVVLKNKDYGYCWLPPDLIPRYKKMGYREAKPADVKKGDFKRDNLTLMVVKEEQQGKVRASTGGWPKGVREVTELKTRRGGE